MLPHNLITCHSFSPHVEFRILLLCLALLSLLEKDQISDSPDLRVGAGHVSSLFMSNSLDYHKRLNHLYLLHFGTKASKASIQKQ